MTKIAKVRSQKLHFHNEDMDYQFMRTLAFQTYGGAELGECFHTASHIKDGDPLSWVQAWTEVAARIEAEAEEALNRGLLLSARESFLRAWNYYRAAGFYLSPKDPQHHLLWGKSLDCFQRFSTLSEPPIEPIEIPYEGKQLSGYFLRVDTSGAKRPTLIINGGGDSAGEEAFFFGGAPAALQRGYNVILFHGPGHPGALHQDASLVFRPDWEVVVKAVVDDALSRPEVDGDQLALMGYSLGGYLVARAVAFEKRIRACIVNPPIIDFYRWVMEQRPHILQKLSPSIIDALARLMERDPLFRVRVEYGFWGTGTSTLAELVESYRAYTLEGLESKIACPMLCLAAEGEGAEALAQAHQFYETLSCPKTLRILTAEEGAEAHCGLNNLSLTHEVMYNWLDEVLAYSF